MYQTSNYGWQCPVCQAVNAPWVSQCPCGGQQQTRWTWYNDTGTIYVDEGGNSDAYDTAK